MTWNILFLVAESEREKTTNDSSYFDCKAGFSLQRTEELKVFRALSGPIYCGSFGRGAENCFFLDLPMFTLEKPDKSYVVVTSPWACAPREVEWRVYQTHIRSCHLYVGEGGFGYYCV